MATAAWAPTAGVLGWRVELMRVALFGMRPVVDAAADGQVTAARAAATLLL